MLSAEELHARGSAAMQTGRVRAARKPLLAALERSGDDALTGSIEASLAYVEAETGNPAEALRLCEQALQRQGLSRTTRGSIHSQHALLTMLAGRSVEAMEEFGVAIDMLTDSPTFLGRAFVNRGNLYLQQSDVIRAEADFAAGLVHLTAADRPEEAAMAQHNLGYTRFLAGDLPQALRDMDLARIVLAPLSPVAEATCDQDRAEVLIAAGLVAEGRTALGGAAHAYGAGRLRRRQAEAELALARSLVLDETVGARAIARRSARRFRLAGADSMAVRAEAVAVAADVEGGRRSTGLVREAVRVSTGLEEQGLVWASSEVRLQHARLHLHRREPELSALLLRHTRIGTRAPLTVRLLDRDVRAELAATQGRRALALQHLRSGLADLHAWQSSFGSLDLQTGVVGHGRRLAGRGLTLAVESRKPTVLFEWSERARMLVSRVQPVRAPEDESTVADLAELREMAAVDGRRDPAREVELRQRVRERAWQQRGSGEVVDPVTLAELTGALDDRTALVAYVVTADAAVALVVTTNGTTWVDLGHRTDLNSLLGGLLPDLDIAATDMPDAMGRFVRAELAGRLATLAELLVAPVLGAVGDRRVVLTPSGVLAGVPWTLLPGFTGRPVTVAQSATSWLARRKTPLRSASAGLVAGPRVARAEDEVTAAAKEWAGARVLVGSAATASAVTELAESVDFLHVAAHGRHSAENPLFSGLQLADGPWFGYDIDRLRQAPDIVLLSACEVGRSNVRWGEELLGMTTAWLHAGARCVIASAAAVNDQAAYNVLVVVHQQLSAGVDPAAALAAAVPVVSADAAPVPLVCFG